MFVNFDCVALIKICCVHEHKTAHLFLCVSNAEISRQNPNIFCRGDNLLLGCIALWIYVGIPVISPLAQIHAIDSKVKSIYLFVSLFYDTFFRSFSL